VRKFASRRVLVVDDEPLLRWCLAETLREAGAAVVEAADGVSALRLLADGPGAIHVVLLDLRLPDCAGLRLLQAIHRLAPAVAVIVMTAFGTPEIRCDALRLGARAVLDKPFEFSELLEVIDRSVAGATN
jgi:DNA-binding NtrC family response regulator